MISPPPPSPLKLTLDLFTFHLPDLDNAFGSHGVNLELWLEMDGYSVKSLLSDPRFPHTPDIRTLAHSFREPHDLGESYASRLYAWFAPPETGNYQFLICKYIMFIVYL